MALNATQLTSNIISALEADSNFSNDLATNAPAQIAYLNIMCTEIVNHIVNNMEINGVTVQEPAGVIETYVAGVGNNGGSLTGQIPIIGNVNKAIQTHTQNNDGTGRVA